MRIVAMYLSRPRLSRLRSPAHLLLPCGAQSSNSWNNVGHEVTVDPVDDSGIDVSHLENCRNLGVSGTAIDPNHISHPPGSIRVSEDHGHSCFDVQENGIRLERCNGACMINRHTALFSTAVLVRVGGNRQRRSPEENRRLRQTVQMAGAS